jgi:hypothetical protein
MTPLTKLNVFLAPFNVPPVPTLLIIAYTVMAIIETKQTSAIVYHTSLNLFKSTILITVLNVLPDVLNVLKTPISVYLAKGNS